MKRFLFGLFALAILALPIQSYAVDVKTPLGSKTDTLIGDAAHTSTDAPIRLQLADKTRASLSVTLDNTTYTTNDADTVKIQARVGNDGANWSAWTTLDSVIATSANVTYTIDLFHAQVDFLISGSTGAGGGPQDARYTELRVTTGDEAATDTIKVTLTPITVE